MVQNGLDMEGRIPNPPFGSYAKMLEPKFRILDRLGPPVGAKLGPSWHQNLENWGLKTMSKK